MKQRGRTAFFLTLAGLLLLAVGGMLGELLRHPGAPSVRGAFLVGWRLR